MKKKIVFVTKALWFGGIETALVNLLKRVDYERYDVTCLILCNEKPMAERLPKQCRLIVADREAQVTFSEKYRYPRLFHLTQTPTNPSGLHRAMMWMVPAIRWVENRLYIRYIREQMKAEEFDTAVIYSDVAAETVVRAIRAKKYLMFYHHGAMRKVYHDEIGYRRSEKIIAVSRNQEEKLRQFRPKYADKMMTIHNLTDVEGIREKAMEPVPDRFDEDKFHIVTCGRASYEKGMDLAVEACAKLVEAGYKHIHWWIVGGGPAEPEIRELIARLHMEDYVTMLGMKSNPYPYIKRADLYVQPSRFEAYGLSIAEALVLERSIVSTDNGGAGETIRSGENGLLCEISAEGIAQCISGLLEKQQRLQALQHSAAAENMDAENAQIIARLELLL